MDPPRRSLGKLATRRRSHGDRSNHWAGYREAGFPSTRSGQVGAAGAEAQVEAERSSAVFLRAAVVLGGDRGQRQCTLLGASDFEFWPHGSADGAAVRQAVCKVAEE